MGRLTAKMQALVATKARKMALVSVIGTALAFSGVIGVLIWTGVIQTNSGQNPDGGGSVNTTNPFLAPNVVAPQLPGIDLKASSFTATLYLHKVNTPTDVLANWVADSDVDKVSDITAAHVAAVMASGLYDPAAYVKFNCTSYAVGTGDIVGGVDHHSLDFYIRQQAISLNAGQTHLLTYGMPSATTKIVYNSYNGSIITTNIDSYGASAENFTVFLTMNMSIADKAWVGYTNYIGQDVNFNIKLVGNSTLAVSNLQCPVLTGVLGTVTANSTLWETNYYSGTMICPFQFSADAVADHVSITYASIALQLGNTAIAAIT